MRGSMTVPEQTKANGRKIEIKRSKTSYMKWVANCLTAFTALPVMAMAFTLLQHANAQQTQLTPMGVRL